MSLNSYIQELTEGRIDFAGQRLVEELARVILIASAVMSFFVGFAVDSLAVTFTMFGGATILLALLVIPPWPIFNQHPVKWLPVIEPKEKAKNS